MDRLLTAEEEEEVIAAFRNLLRGRSRAVGDIRRLAKRILDRIDN
jgi:hypothetical protein